VPFGRLAEWLKLFSLLACAPWFRAVTVGLIGLVVLAGALGCLEGFDRTKDCAI